MSFVYDAEKDPVRGEFVHVDFYALDVDKPITADVMIVFEGVAPAVKELGGVLVKCSAQTGNRSSAEKISARNKN